jgi:FkbM family methyltransferase
MWKPAHSVVFGAARLWNKYAPRGKGAIPRLLGRTLGKNLQVYVSTAGGARLAVQPSSLDVYVDIVNHGGVWNEHVFTTCASLLEKGHVFWDVGANVGYMSIEMARKFQDEVHVFSFEPQPVLSHIIAVSAALNDFSNVKVFETMLGDVDGEAELYVGSHAIHASARPREKHSKRVTRCVVTIDSLVQTAQVMAPHVIKMDIEGGELSALLGAKDVISTHKPHIIFETDENMIRFGYERKDILQLLSECAPYEFYFIDKNGSLIPVGPFNLNAPYSDILATIRARTHLAK